MAKHIKQRRCEHCSNPFRISRYWQRFCSTKCRVDHFYEETQEVRRIVRERREAEKAEAP